MFIRTIFLCCLINIVYTREDVDESIAQLTDQIIYELQKRLHEDPDQVDGLADEQCRRQINNNTIIKADASIENGANFLDIPNVVSFDDCFSQCCNTDDCDTAVYKFRVWVFLARYAAFIVANYGIRHSNVLATALLVLILNERCTWCV